MRIVFVLVFFCGGIWGKAQNRCATPGYLDALRLSGAGSVQQKQVAGRQVQDEATIRIPVVIHVLYNTPAQNISDAQVRSGIEALNRDFRKRNADTVNTPYHFRHLAADVQLEFYLATADPFGRRTTGIVRKQTARNGWMADDKMKMASEGGDNAWDSRNYLNIWIVNLIGGSGYSSVPGSAPETDGVVVSCTAFGTANTATPFNMSRTAVHEVGHWLGLKHIWGDAQCGDDGVDDTPRQSFFTQGCPSGFRTSCNNDETGDMYMNYMDYTSDACMNLFTKGQRRKMRSLFAEGGARASLLQSRGLDEPWMQEVLLPTEASIFPNPAYDKINIRLSSHQLGKKLSLFNSQGQLQKEVVTNSLQQVLGISFLKPGVYFLKGDGYNQKIIKL